VNDQWLSFCNVRNINMEFPEDYQSCTDINVKQKDNVEEEQQDHNSSQNSSDFDPNLEVYISPRTGESESFLFHSAKASLSTDHGVHRDPSTAMETNVEIPGVSFSPSTLEKEFEKESIATKSSRLPGRELEQLKLDSTRGSFQPYMSDTQVDDPIKPPNDIGRVSSHWLETDTKRSAGGSSVSSGTSGSSIYKYPSKVTGNDDYDGSNDGNITLNQTSYHDGEDLFPSQENLSIRIKDMIELNERKNSMLNPGKSVAKIMSRISFKPGIGDEKADLDQDEDENMKPTFSPLDGDSDSSLSNVDRQGNSASSSLPASPQPLMRQRRKEKKLKAQTIPQPKNILPVRCFYKSKHSSDFNPLLLITTLNKAHDGPIWCTEFSKDGKYLATGGKDSVLQIWKIAPSKEMMNRAPNFTDNIHQMWNGFIQEDEHDSSANPLSTIHNGSNPVGTDIVVIFPDPVQRFTDHDKDIVDLSWSDTGFLVSASMDKTARLWHPTRSKCLRVFRHADVVTSVEFHPQEDRYFLSGGFDKKIRIWNIPDGRVAEWAQSPHVVTAATFQPDAKYIAAGLFDGKVIFYSLEEMKLKYFTQITAKNRRSKRGKKVTGLTFLPQLSEDKVETQVLSSESPRNPRKKAFDKAADFVKSFTSPKRKTTKQQLLITTNDSRLRLVGTNDFCMVRKYKGHLNSSLQIRAKFSESGNFIISGSEAKTCNIWNTATRRNPLNVNVTGLNMYDKVKSYEAFEATKCDPPIVTDASFVPASSAKSAIMTSGLFPSLKSLDSVSHDLSSSMILTTDYAGTIRVFLQRSCLDAITYAAGPAGKDFS
jgi:WD40 repeat protein